MQNPLEFLGMSRPRSGLTLRHYRRLEDLTIPSMFKGLHYEKHFLNTSHWLSCWALGKSWRGAVVRVGNLGKLGHLQYFKKPK